jgi:tetratricopeptide (TPR) repeat protein
VDWATYVDAHARAHGGLTPLADELLRRAREMESLPDDAGTVERGLRRLRSRGNKPGGQYGRWMLRFFGAPLDIERWAKWMAQYHTRFADLPALLRRDQLRAWDRPPISESRLGAWVQLGLASVCHRLRDLEACDAHLQRAERRAAAAGPAAQCEAALLRARLLSDDGRSDDAHAKLDEVATRLDDAAMEEGDREAYATRLAGQRAYLLTRPSSGEPPDLDAALALFEQLPADAGSFFVRYRRAAGLSWTHFQLGHEEEARALARQALAWAGDGGLVRFRVMALNLLCGMTQDADEARALNARAAAMARALDDEDLAERVARRAPR